MRTGICLGLLAILFLNFGKPTSLFGADVINSAARTKIKYLLPENSAAVFFSGNSPSIWDTPEGSSFFRLTGIAQARCILFLFPSEILFNGNRVTEILFIPNSGEWPSHWAESALTYTDAQKISGIQSVFSLDELPGLLEELKRNNWANQFLLTQFPHSSDYNPFNASYEKALGNLRNTLKIPYAYSEKLSQLYQEVYKSPSSNHELMAQKARNHLAYYPELRQDSLLQAIAAIQSATDLTRVKSSIQEIQANLTILPNLLTKLIDKKTPEEINRYKAAAAECARSLDEWLKIIEPEIPAQKLAASWEIISCNQTMCQPLKTQVLAGVQILSPAISPTSVRVKAGELLRVKTGIRYQGYPIEITRTVPASGKYTPEQRTLLSIALRAQEAGLKKIRPGVHLSEIQDAMKAALFAGLKESDLVKNESELNKYIPESLVTHVSLSSEEFGSDEALEAGAILYLKPILTIYPQSSCPQAWWNLSIAVSDPVILSSTGAEFLELTLPRTATELESRVAETSLFNQVIR